MLRSASRAAIARSSHPGCSSKRVVEPHQILSCHQVIGLVEPAVTCPSCARVEVEPIDAPAQVLPHEKHAQVFGAVRGAHVQLVRPRHRLTDAMQQGTQRNDAVTGEDGDANAGESWSCGAGLAGPTAPAAERCACGAPLAGPTAPAAHGAPASSSATIMASTRCAASSTGGDSSSPNVSMSTASMANTTTSSGIGYPKRRPSSRAVPRWML